MKTTLFTLCFIMSTLAFSNEFPLPKPTPYFTAVSPIFGYDPAYGTLLGMALFYYPTGDVEEATIERSLNLVMRLGPHGSLNYSERNSTWKGVWGYQYNASINNFYDYKTLDNSNEIASKSSQLTTDVGIQGLYQWSPNWHLFLGYSFALQRKEANDDTSESYVSTGVVRDTRDNTTNSHRGTYFSQVINYQAPFLSSELDTHSVQLKSDARIFVPLGEQKTLALRAIAETSFGEGFSSKVGGSELLRGYLGGQYEAPSLVATQSELRFPVWSFIRAVAFVEAADLISEKNHEWVSTAGFGFRFGLPPDQTMSVRWDNAINDNGQWLTYVNFNQVF